MDDNALANYYDSLKAKGPKGKSGLGFRGPSKKDEEEKPTCGLRAYPIRSAHRLFF